MSEACARPVLSGSGTVRLALQESTQFAARPPADEVAVWRISLDAPPAAFQELFSLLTPEEQARANRYKVARPREQFVIGRGLLRRILGNCLGMSAHAVPILYSGAGKPIVADTGCGLHFNVTHTDGLALIALGNRPLGIDTERVRAVADEPGLVRRFFSSAEQAAYLDLPPELRSPGFFRAWTCKEAIIKAAGLSVLCLDGFDVELDPRRPVAILGARHPDVVGKGWELTAWEPQPGFTAAVARLV